MGKFLVYQDRLETNLWQLFAHPQTSQWFSVVSGIIFVVNVISGQKQAYVSFFCFLQASIVFSFFTSPTVQPLFRRPWHPSLNCLFVDILSGNVVAL